MQALLEGEGSQDSASLLLTMTFFFNSQQLQGEIHDLKSTIKSLENDKALLAEENENLKRE